MLTREQLLGDMFQAGFLGYYAQYTALSYIAGLKQGGHHQLVAGVGSFGYEPNVDTFFGIPRRLTAGGMAMNIPIVNAMQQDGSDATAKRNFSIQLGVLASTLEHVVPEQMFTSATNPGEAISVVKALHKASAQGQRIYQITQANQATILPNIHHDSGTMDEIRSALAVGKTVITHTAAVSVPRWNGAGYVILDPETGAGAWKIAGGSNGGFISDDASGFLTWIGMSVGVVGAALTIPMLVFISAAIAILLAIDLYLDYLALDSSCIGFEYLIVASIVFSLIAVIATAGVGLLVGYISFIIAGAVLPAAGSPICRRGP